MMCRHGPHIFAGETVSLHVITEFVRENNGRRVRTGPDVGVFVFLIFLIELSFDVL